MKFGILCGITLIFSISASGCATNAKRTPSSVEDSDSGRQKGLLCTLAEGKEGDNRNLIYKRAWFAFADLNKAQRKIIEGNNYDLEINTHSGAFSIGVQVNKSYKSAPGRGLTVSGYIHDTENSDSANVISFSETDKGSLYSNVYCDFGQFKANDRL